MEISQADWESLQNLASRVGGPTEKVSLLRRRMEAPPSRPGSPYTLVAGLQDSGIELFLARWLGPEVAEELKRTGERPMVIGPRTGEVQPRLGTWPTFKVTSIETGHLIALRTIARPTADILAQLASLGLIDQAVLVTRLGQPLQMREREVASSLAPFAATVRVLVVGLPGEEATENELAEVSAYAVKQMRQAGFRGGRCVGAGVWFTEGKEAPGAISDLRSFLSVDQASVAFGRHGMNATALAAVIDEIRQKADLLPAAPAPVAEDECDRLIREFERYLTDIGQEIGRDVQKPLAMSAERLRKQVQDTIRSWGAYTTIEGHWLKYVERIKPGTQRELLAKVDDAIGLLDYHPGTGPGVPIPAADSSSPNNRGAVDAEDSSSVISLGGPSQRFPAFAFSMAKRVGVGVALGIVLYLAVTNLLGAPGAGWNAGVVNLLSYLAVVVGIALGYGVSGLFFQHGAPVPPTDSTAPTPPAIHGWPQVERRLIAWFSEHIRSSPLSPAEECQALAQRLIVTEIEA